MNTSEMPSIDYSESPTQVNEGRSYDRYQDPISSGISQNPNEGMLGLGVVDDELPERTLDENETGAVNFGPGDLNSDSSMPNDAGTISRGFSHFFSHSEDDPPQDAPQEGYEEPPLQTMAVPPETPGPPKNPFAGRFQTPLLAGSQLFGQTPSSAFPLQGSPTSSRPSPSNFPTHNAITPAGVGIFSALDAQDTQTPPVNLMPLSTSSQSKFDDYDITPRPVEFSEPTEAPELPEMPPPEPATVAQLSPTGHKRKAPVPLEEYVSVHQSQMQREASGRFRHPSNGNHDSDHDSDFDSSSDDGADEASQMRRRRARSKREAGAKMLSTVSLSRSLRQEDSVEVPSSTKKERPIQPGGRRQPPDRHQISGAPEVCPESNTRAADEDRAHGEEANDTSIVEMPTAKGPLPVHDSVEEVAVPESFIANSSDVKAPQPSISNTPYSPTPGLPAMVPATERKGKLCTQPMGSLNDPYTIPETSPAIKQERAEVPLTNTTAVVESSPSLPQNYAARNHIPTSQTVSTAANTSDAIAMLSPQVAEGGKDEAHAIPMSDDIEQHLPQHRQTHNEDMMTTPSAEEKVKDDVVRDTSPVTSSPPSMLPPALSTRAQKRRVGDIDTDTKPEQPKFPKSSSVSRSASAISSLSGTPSIPSREATPITAAESDLSSEKKIVSSRKIKAEVLSSPHVKRRLRSRVHIPANSERRESPAPSGSTDELAGSPPSDHTALETSAPRAVRKSTTRSGLRLTHDVSPSGRQRSHGPVPIFDGMAFAISFQSKRPGETEDAYGERMEQAKNLEHRILEAGGMILQDGFDELFEKPPVMQLQQQRRHYHHLQHYAQEETTEPVPSELRLLPDKASAGFAVLVADGHSRKSKYMQALALGLPCLAPRWVTTCLDKAAAAEDSVNGESTDNLVDWSPYLLCAGQSSFLGDGAIRSRNLEPYDATTAQLADVVHTRPRLLAGVSILLVARRGTEEKNRWVYIFLVHVLGASLSRAHSIEEARERLVAMEAAGRPFDWVYVDGKDGSSAGDGLFRNEGADSETLPPPNKRRKRSSTAAKAKANRGSHPAPKRVKILTDERVVQSLILGKWIEDDDLGK